MKDKRSHHGSLSVAAVDLVAARFRTLGEPIRIELLQALRRGERNVSELVAAVGSTQPNVSRHLRILQDSGLVRRRQEGNSAYYAILDPSVFDLCDVACSGIERRLERAAELATHLRVDEEAEAHTDVWPGSPPESVVSDSVAKKGAPPFDV